MDVGATSLRETEELLVPQNLWEQTNKGEVLFEEHDMSSGCSRLQGTTTEGRGRFSGTKGRVTGARPASSRKLQGYQPLPWRHCDIRHWLRTGRGYQQGQQQQHIRMPHMTAGVCAPRAVIG